MSGHLHQPPDGVFESKFNTDCDLKSVILPYRERCKYTLGEKYTSWETQGEFIFVKTKGEKWDWNFGLEILCDRGNYWIKPVMGSILFKNGVKYRDRFKIQLNFGDELAFTKYHNDIYGGLATFIFKRRTYSTNLDKSMKIGVNDSNAIGQENGAKFILDKNQLIFSQILSHLPVQSLKNARLVCHHWDDQVIPILRNKSAINFNSDPSSANPSLKFLRYAHEMQNWQNWKISYPKLPRPECDKAQRGAKYVLDLDWFLTLNRHCVKSLSLCGEIYTDYNYRTYVKAALQFADTLEELRLDFKMKLVNKVGLQKEYSAWDRPLKFKKLHKFSFCLDFLGDKPDLTTRKLVAAWMHNWTDAIKSVQSISTLGNASLGSRFVERLQNTGTRLYTNLSEISLTCEPDDAIKLLTEVNNPLEKLTLTIPLEKEHLPLFENLLEKFAPSLELLSFRISTDCMAPKSRFVLNLPCLPNLKSLNVHFGGFFDDSIYKGDGYDFCDFYTEAKLWLAFPGEEGGINYERHLPSIREIIIHPEILSDEEDIDGFCQIEENGESFWNSYSDLMDSLLPKEAGQRCKTLVNFEIPDFDDIQIEKGYRQAHRLREIFPNVRNKWINFGRLRKIKDFFSM